MDILKMLEQLIPVLGQKGVDELTAQINGLISDQSPQWQKSILALISSALQQFGVAGIEVAIKQVEAMLDGKEPEIDWANLLVASDLVASLQNAEADRKSAVKDYLTKVGEVLGVLLHGLVKALLV